MKNFIIDVEANGPCPGLYSMVSFGAVLVDGKNHVTFKGKVKPITDLYDPEAYKAIGVTYEEHLTYNDPLEVMMAFNKWVKNTVGSDRATFISDNNGFDWQFINYYFHKYVKSNPFGFSSRRIGDLYAGYVGDITASNKWKYLRKTKHNHDALTDAIGNAEALWDIMNMMKKENNSII
jgi:DNA polymerase III epsilon subunit-like protein